MTDNEIIKALECCPLDDIGECRKTNALFSRINRLKVEIERLKAENEEQHQAIINAFHRMGEIRSEAIKEFAKKWKAKRVITYCTCGKRIDITENFNDCVDILVKEMTEDGK